LAKAGLSLITIHSKKYQTKSGEDSYSYYISYSKIKDCKKLYRYLYEDVSSGQYLERKYKVFENYFGKLDDMQIDYDDGPKEILLSFEKLHMNYSDRPKDMLRPKGMFTSFEKYCNDSNYKITNEAKSKLQVISQILKRDKVILYPVSVKKFFIKAIARQTKRISGIENITNEILCTITEDDIPSVNEFSKIKDSTI
jgi:hypothetical protein